MGRWEGMIEFVQVVESGSFSAAARVLGSSKSHVSQQVSRLEDRLNTRLLHRTTRKVSLTETGTTYYDQCRQIVEDLETADRSVTQLQQEVRGLLRINAPHLIGEVLLVPAIAEFLSFNPQLEIELNLASHKVDLVEERYDLSIEVGVRESSNVINRVLCQTYFHVVASPEYAEERGLPTTPQELKDHRCLLFLASGESKPWKFQGDNKTENIAVQSYWRSNSGHALRQAACQGLGLAYLPDYYLHEQLSSGTLVTALNDWSAIERNIVAVATHRRHLSNKIRLFTEFLQQYFQENFVGTKTAVRSF